MQGMSHGEGNGLISIFDFLVISRWIYFAAIFVVFGSSLFWFYMGRDQSSDSPDGLPRPFRATVLLLCIAALVAAISGVAWLAGILANMTGGFADVVDPETLHLFFFETTFGPVSIVRLFLLAVLTVIAFLPWHNRVWLSSLAVISTVLLISQAWLGHAAEGGSGLYGMWMIISYSIHMCAAGAWVGGLPPLFFALVEQRNANRDQSRQRTLEILSHYSLMGFVAVTLIVVSGIVNAGFRVAGSFGKLFNTGYGDVLFAKISIVIVMLGLAFFNRFILMPKLRSESFNELTQIKALRRHIGFEFALGILVLGIAAVLGITPPPQ